MIPISKDIVPGIKWDVRPGTHFARCYNQSCYGRILGDDEVDVTFVSEWGSVNSFGRAKCKICGAEYAWDFTDHRESLKDERRKRIMENG